MLNLYDEAVWPDDKSFYLDIQNGASLLARLESFGVDVGDRWNSLGVVSEEKIGDHVLWFTEPHYTMAMGRTGKQNQISKQITSLQKLTNSASQDTQRTVENLAIPVCSAILFNHESEMRSKDYVIPKLANYINNKEYKNKNKLKFGNINIKRDWGWSLEFMEV